MKIFTVVLWCIGIIYIITYFILLILSEKPIKYFFMNALCSWWCFAIIELTSFYTGLHLPLNYGTALVSGVFGVPGVALLEVMKYVIFI